MVTLEIVLKVHDMVMYGRQVTVRYIACVVGFSQEMVNSIFTEDLEVRKLSARWLLRLLSVDRKHTKLNMSHSNLNLFETNPDKFLLRCVSRDET